MISLHSSDDITYGYYINDEFVEHNENGPAIKFKNGGEMWCFHGKIHRLDGPALKLSNGLEWYFVNDINCEKNNFEDMVEIYKLNLICK